MLEVRPITTKSVSAGTLMFLGDVTQQAIEYRSLNGDKKEGKMRGFSNYYNPYRSARMGIFGTCFIGPVFHRWFNVLERLVPGSSPRAAFTKMAIDQLGMAPVFTVTFFSAMGAMEGQSPSQIITKVKEATWPALLINWSVWPAAQLINFKVMPIQWRVLWMNTVGLGMNVVLSKLAHPTKSTDEDVPTSTTETSSTPPSTTSSTSPALLASTTSSTSSVSSTSSTIPATWSSHVHAHGGFDQLWSGRMWQIRGSLPRAPERNMTVFKMPNGGLMLHSVIALDEARMAQLEQLGRPEVMIVPNSWHRADAAVFKERYPNLKVVCPKAAMTKVNEKVKVDISAEEYFANSSSSGVTPITVDGMAPGELAYVLDLGSNGERALVVCDLMFNIPKAPDGLNGVILRVFGSVGPLGVTRMGRWTFVKDQPAMASWMRRISDGRYDFRVMTVAHGNACTEDVRGHLQRAAQRLES